VNTIVAKIAMNEYSKTKASNSNMVYSSSLNKVWFLYLTSGIFVIVKIIFVFGGISFLTSTIILLVIFEKCYFNIL